MVDIRPFKALMYNQNKISKLDDVTSPPYDIISEDMQKQLYEKHPQNFVRLILGKQFPDDNEKNNRYTRAKELYNKWINDAILVKSEKPAIYPYRIEYKLNNQIKVMNGFFALLKLDPEYKYVKAHEKTLSKPKADRLNLMRACNTNFEPIQLLYIDKEDKIKKKIDENINSPIADVIGYDNFNHKLWKIENENVINQIQTEFKNKILFIADGHHRYQTALDYEKEIKEKTGNNDENAPFNFRMVVLVNMFDKGLSILPTHRLIKKFDLDIDIILKKLKEYFIVEEKKVDIKVEHDTEISKKIKKHLKVNKEHKFVMYLKNRYYVLTLKDEKIMDNFAKEHSKTWRILDVSILHKVVIEHIMGINQNNIEDYVKYTRVDEEAIKFVNEGKYNLSFLMNATKIDELKAVAESGEHMPQKSTYFLPKMLSGLVMYQM
ncbi:MAG: DUF1015 domain-containing protein [Thermoplasmatota archaeon]|jgi:uncharacterized protein (DUF1015 family)